MLLSILKKANANGVKTDYIKGTTLGADESFAKTGKIVVFEHLVGSVYDTPRGKYEALVDFNQEAKIYHLCHVDALVIEGYAIIVHQDAPTGGVYKLDKAKENKLTSIRTPGASFFGLDGVRPFAFENDDEISLNSNEEWEDFLCTMTALGLINEEDTEILQSATVSAF